MSVAAKLQLKPGMTVTVLRVPDTLTTELTTGCVAAEAGAADAVLVFAENRKQLLTDGEPLVEAARRDALAWLAYPKGGQLGTDLNRESVVSLLAPRGIRPVRQVAIDGIWSALRFRPE